MLELCDFEEDASTSSFRSSARSASCKGLGTSHARTKELQEQHEPQEGLDRVDGVRDFYPNLLKE
jgi:hypothetical protein